MKTGMSIPAALYCLLAAGTFVWTAQAQGPPATGPKVLRPTGPRGVDMEAIRRAQQRLLNMQERMAKQLEDALENGGVLGGMPGLPGLPGGPLGAMGRERGERTDPHLGAQLRVPDDTLADQLDLPKGQGVVIGELAPNSAAAKAGMKKNDILLEVDGKAVPSDLEALQAQLGRAGPGKVEAVVMRKGTKQRLSGLQLTPATPSGGPAPLGTGSLTRVTRKDGRFSVSNQSKGREVIVTGELVAGKPKVEQVQVRQAGKEDTYAGEGRVPAELKELVKQLVVLAGEEE